MVPDGELFCNGCGHQPPESASCPKNAPSKGAGKGGSTNDGTKKGGGKGSSDAGKGIVERQDKATEMVAR